MASYIVQPLAPEDNMRHPEIENGLITRAHLNERESLQGVSTSIDLLEVPHNPFNEARWHEGLDHHALVKHFEVQIE